MQRCVLCEGFNGDGKHVCRLQREYVVLPFFIEFQLQFTECVHAARTHTHTNTSKEKEKQTNEKAKWFKR